MMNFCSHCGSQRLEMDFLADVWVTCPVCEGRRFTRETLQIRFKDKSIRDVLEMDVQEALEHSANVPKVRAMFSSVVAPRCCATTTTGPTPSSSAIPPTIAGSSR